MTLPGNLHDAYEEYERLRSDLEKALTEAEATQRGGKSGYDAICRAQALSKRLNRERTMLLAKIEEARQSL